MPRDASLQDVSMNLFLLISIAAAFGVLVIKFSFQNGSIRRLGVSIIRNLEKCFNPKLVGLEVYLAWVRVHEG